MKKLLLKNVLLLLTVVSMFSCKDSDSGTLDQNLNIVGIWEVQELYGENRYQRFTENGSIIYVNVDIKKVIGIEKKIQISFVIL